jgi:hypothetical protein
MRNAEASRPRWRLAAAGALALLACVAGVLVDRRAFFAAWLVGWWFWIGMAVGSQAILWLHRLTGGEWGELLREPLQRARAMMPVLALFVVPILIGMSALYPWAHAGWVDTAAQPAFRRIWLSPMAMVIRTAVVVLLWVGLCNWQGRSSKPARAGMAAAGLLLLGYSVSLASFDLIMSLMPQWYSTGFGLLVITAQMKAAMATCTWLRTKAARPALRVDMGNFLLMYVMTWSYLAFTQFQIIWAENLPHEISWYLPRLQTQWVWLAIFIVVAGLAIPLPLLLFKRIKTSLAGLRGLAALLIAMSWIEIVWLILPSVGRLSLHVLWMLPLATIGMGALAIVATRAPVAETADSFDRIEDSGGEHA